MLNDFAVFILTHGRANNVITYKTLRRTGYTGRIFIIVDNEDKQVAQYHKNFGDEVIVFDKAEIAKTFDVGDNFQNRSHIVYARNASFNIANTLGVKYFMQLDDDYFNLCYKIDSKFQYVNSDNTTSVKNADAIISLLLEFYKNVNCAALAIGQGGDYAGGKLSTAWTATGTRRKAMNTFICSTARQFQFVGNWNEDVNIYTATQNRGTLFLTFPLLAIQQKETQKNAGGLTETYLKTGTYIKSFYTVMYQPSSVTVSLMGTAHKRLHHRINWNATVPCIVRESVRKGS